MNKNELVELAKSIVENVGNMTLKEFENDEVIGIPKTVLFRLYESAKDVLNPPMPINLCNELAIGRVRNTPKNKARKSK